MQARTATRLAALIFVLLPLLPFGIRLQPGLTFTPTDMAWSGVSILIDWCIALGLWRYHRISLFVAYVLGVLTVVGNLATAGSALLVPPAQALPAYLVAAKMAVVILLLALIALILLVLPVTRRAFGIAGTP